MKLAPKIVPVRGTQIGWLTAVMQVVSTKAPLASFSLRLLCPAVAPCCDLFISSPKFRHLKGVHDLYRNKIIQSQRNKSFQLFVMFIGYWWSCKYYSWNLNLMVQRAILLI